MIWKKILCICKGMLLSFYCLAEESILTPVLPEPAQGYWIFSGLVNNENQEPLGYFFQMEKKDTWFHIRMAVMDENSGKLLLHYDEAAELDNAIDFNWKVGHAFLRFNPINETWVFGYKMPDKTGFNFKVNMLDNSLEKGKSQTISPGMEAILYQTGRVDGLLQTEPQGNEQFVAANNAWFSKIWMSKAIPELPALHTGFCKFTDGSGFYSGRLQKNAIKQSSFASFRDPEGLMVRMSQFINIDSTDNNLWKINLALPKLLLSVQNKLAHLDKKDLAAGFFPEVPKGFCFFSEQHFLG